MNRLLERRLPWRRLTTGLCCALALGAVAGAWQGSAHAAEAGAAAAAAPASAAMPSAADERRRLDAEQGAAEARYREREAQCRRQFIVTACVNEAKAERREVLERLRSQRLLLDEAARKQRAADRLAEIERRQQERADGEREAAARAAQRASDVSGRGAREAAAPASAAGRSLSVPQPPSAQERRAEEARAAERARERAARASEAEAHREKVLERNRREPPAAPLPTPSAPR